MPDSKESSGNGSGNKKRQLPSWMSARDEESEPSERRPAEGKRDEGVKHGKVVHGKGKEPSRILPSDENHSGPEKASSTATDFSKLLDGVVFVLSGFVNPERSTLRSQALAMGAEYQADWNANCTMLICAFRNTPKFRQVQSDCGTIVAKEWLSECYEQKKLVDIDTHLMHPGKPWRRNNNIQEVSPAKEIPTTRKGGEAVEKQVHSKSAARSPTKKVKHEPVKEFALSVVKQWVKDDLEKTMSWLLSLEEKPDPSEMNDIAAQGILTCMQDAIDLLDSNQDMGKLREQWSCIPHIVEELEKLEKLATSVSIHNLRKQAVNYKRVYESELQHLTFKSSKKPKNGESHTAPSKIAPDASHKATGYDSDETIEMTEEEIDMAFKNAVA